jgi:TubC N-terminal docking domain
MTAALDLIREAEAQGVRLLVEGAKLKSRSKSPIHDELLGRLREHKPEIIALLTEGAPTNPAAPSKPLPIELIDLARAAPREPPRYRPGRDALYVARVLALSAKTSACPTRSRA